MLDFLFFECPFCGYSRRQKPSQDRVGKHSCAMEDFVVSYARGDEVYKIVSGGLTIEAQVSQIYTTKACRSFIRQYQLIFRAPNGEVLFKRKGSEVLEEEFRFYKDKADKIGLLC